MRRICNWKASRTDDKERESERRLEEKEEGRIVDSMGFVEARKEGPRRPDRLTPGTSPSETTGGAPRRCCACVSRSIRA
ncbi:unnamed protein product [Lasius platythorax]|uniref:Uncharacterized protein n=1 Tax=Lasius platythorax TaxID=488582 RepID=A0AAV2NKG2_9HYME